MAAGRGIVAGLLGTAAMTLFQRAVEMPLSGRGESDAPLALVERLLPIRRVRGSERRRATYLAHFGIGALWGAGHAALSRASGARAQRAVALAFATQYAGDVALNTALGLYEPRRWSGRDWLVDVGNKLVLAEVTGLAYDRLARR